MLWGWGLGFVGGGFKVASFDTHGCRWAVDCEKSRGTGQKDEEKCGPVSESETQATGMNQSRGLSAGLRRAAAPPPPPAAPTVTWERKEESERRLRTHAWLSSLAGASWPPGVCNVKT